MWEPVEVQEWLEDLPQADQSRYRVWYMQVRRLHQPAAPPLRSACGLYRWRHRDMPHPWPLYDEDLIARARQEAWQHYAATGAFPASTWDATPYERRTP